MHSSHSWPLLQPVYESQRLRARFCSAADGPADPIEVFKFPEEVMEAAEARGMALPFAVVGSRECDVIDEEEVPLRHYPWGTCLPLRKEHSDAVFFRYGLLASPLWLHSSLM